jgi:hypothetical protein
VHVQSTKLTLCVTDSVSSYRVSEESISRNESSKSTPGPLKFSKDVDICGKIKLPELCILAISAGLLPHVVLIPHTVCQKKYLSQQAQVSTDVAQLFQGCVYRWKK